MKIPEFVAEVSSNHHQDLSRCFQFVEKAAQIGCSAVKFQLFKIEELFAPEVLKKNSGLRARKAWELPLYFVPEIKARCREKNIQFSCTPFYLEAVDELFPYVDFYKIASYELLWNDLLIACAKTGKPIVLSTGMATIKEIKQALEVLQKAGCCELTILHCVSGYPAPVLESNLAVIETLRRELKWQSKIKFGWSDHSVTSGVLYRAVFTWQADMVEFHLDLDGMGEEFFSGHCWLPEHIKEVIKQVKNGFKADGRGIKAPVESELPDRNWRADPFDGLRPLKNFR